MATGCLTLEQTMRTEVNKTENTDVMVHSIPSCNTVLDLSTKGKHYNALGKKRQYLSKGKKIMVKLGGKVTLMKKDEVSRFIKYVNSNSGYNKPDRTLTRLKTQMDQIFQESSKSDIVLKRRDDQFCLNRSRFEVIIYPRDVYEKDRNINIEGMAKRQTHQVDFAPNSMNMNFTCFEENNLDKTSYGTETNNLDEKSYGSETNNMDRNFYGTETNNGDRNSHGTETNNMDEYSYGTETNNMDENSYGTETNNMGENSYATETANMDENSNGTETNNMDRNPYGTETNKTGVYSHSYSSTSHDSQMSINRISDILYLDTSTYDDICQVNKASNDIDEDYGHPSYSADNLSLIMDIDDIQKKTKSLFLFHATRFVRKTKFGKKKLSKES